MHARYVVVANAQAMQQQFHTQPIERFAIFSVIGCGTIESDGQTFIACLMYGERTGPEAVATGLDYREVTVTIESFSNDAFLG